MPSYATPADVIPSFDIRRLSQFLSDTGTPVCTPTEITNGQCALTVLPANANLLDLIGKASGMVLTAARVANRYLQADLDKIYADTNRRQQLVDVVVGLTIGRIVSRRGLAQHEVIAMAPQYGEALQFLEMLKRGDRVFDDSPPDGTDAPLYGAKVNTVVAPPGAGACGCGAAAITPRCITLWTAQTGRLFPGPNSGGM